MKFNTISNLTLTIACLATYAANPLRGDETVTDIGSRLELLVDDHLIQEITGGAKLVLHHPTPRQTAIVYNESWEGNTSGYPTMLKDGGTYRLYYRGHRYLIGDKLEMAQPEVTCYAESRDGIHWTKPKLGLVEWNGSKDNNIIWRDVGVHNFAPFLDENPSCSPDAKFKAVGGTANTGLHAFKSADGIHWEKIAENAVYTKGAFDSRNTAFWDPARNRYALYLRFFSEGEFKGLRSIATAHSTDFVNWSDSKPLDYQDSPPQQMYTNQVLPYFRAPHILFGFPTRYVDRPTTEHVERLPPVELRSRLTKAARRVGSDLSEGVFMTSRDGVSFHRWDEAFIRPGPQHEGRWIYGDVYQSYGLVETASTIPGGPNEISFYVSEGSWREGQTSERRYTIRLDGFVSAQAPLSGGEVVTKPLRFSGDRLLINYATSAAGSVRVEIQDAEGKPLPGFTLADSPEHYGDAVDQVVRWKAGPGLRSLARRPARLRFVLKDADLFSYRFAP